MPLLNNLKKHDFIKQNPILFWWNVWISESRSSESPATETMRFCELLNQWNFMFFKHPLQTIGYLTKSPLLSYYRFTLENQRRSINNSHIFYHKLILKSYPKHYQLISLFDFVTIIIDKVEILEWLILVWFLALP